MPSPYNSANTKPDKIGFYVGKHGFDATRLWWSGENWHTVTMREKVLKIAERPARKQNQKWRELETWKEMK